MALAVPRTAALLFFVFHLAYIFTPYWRTLPASGEGWAALAVSVPLGVLWAWTANGGFAVRIERRDSAAFALLLAAVGGLSARALSSDVPWHGDEDFHIMASAPLAARLQPYLVHVLSVAGAYVLAAVAIARRATWMSVALMIGIALTALVPHPLFEYGRYDPLRYPFISRYAAAVPLSLATLCVSPPPEMVYRVVPFVSAVLMAFMVARHAAPRSWAVRLLAGVFVFTTPVLFYYSSILYLELPAVLLMTIVALHSEELLRGNLRSAVHHPAWVALVLIGFIKETALPFLIAFVACRLATQIGTQRRPSFGWPSLLQETRTVVAVLVPIGVFLLYRTQRANQRAPSFARHNLIDPEVYAVFARAYAEQFGVVLLCAFFGLLVLLSRRRFTAVAFLVTAYAADTVLHVVDFKEYAGYSRFDLFVLPLVLVAALEAIVWLRTRGPRLAAGALAIGIGCNLLQSPINADGSKTPLWGNYLIDTSEHYYPYLRAEQWIRDRGLADARIRFTGMPDEYYMVGFLRPFPNQDEKLVPRGGIEVRTLEQALEDAAADGRDVVVYHVVGDTVPVPTRTAGFLPGETIANQAHALVVFVRAGR